MLFRSSFNVRLPRRVHQGNVEVLVEPKHTPDLVIRSRADKSFYAVVEFKIDAALADHQNPLKSDFKSGYGRQFERLRVQGWKNLCYAIYQQESPTQLPRNKFGKTILVKHWNELLKGVDKETAMEADLFDCLGWLGVRCFNYRNTPTTMMDKIQSAIDVHQLLRGVLEERNLFQAVRQTRPTAGRTDQGWYYGLNFSVKIDGRWVKGWFGYECEG